MMDVEFLGYSKIKEVFVGLRIITYLEYDGENPIRKDFICELENEAVPLKKWEDLYTSTMTEYSSKKDSLKTIKDSAHYGTHSWSINKICPQIEAIQREIELDTQLEEEDKLNLERIIITLKSLYEEVMEICRERGLKSEKCYIIWWVMY